MHLPLDIFGKLGLSRHPILVPAAAAGAAAAIGAGVWLVVRKRPSAAELEQRRRRLLAAHGSIVDGTVIGVDPTELDPRLVFYTYRVAGVTYECSQDVSGLGVRVHNVQLDVPVQVRYARANPGNSIVMEESWNGLWTADTESAPAPVLEPEVDQAS